MLVEKDDGCCRNCQGILMIIDADDIALTVECETCCDFYLVEHDAFGDGGMTYYVGFLMGQTSRDEGEA